MLTFETTTTFVGPKEELDKLEAVNWNFLSCTSDGSREPTHFANIVRTSDNSLTIEGICEQEICG